MSQRAGTRTQSVDHGSGKASGELHPVPGLLLAFTSGEPRCVALPIGQGPIELGRGEGASSLPADPKMSRRHAAVSYTGQQFRIEDLGSHNGSFLDGVRVQSGAASATARVLRTGESIFLLCPDVRPLMTAGVVKKGDLILGPSVQAALGQAARAAQFGRTLHITGESGSGKEGLARAFHAASPLAKGPLVALNCATLASGVAERLLFGTKRGAFSGATADADGLVQSADGGTLFLDEVGELDPAVQAKLLRVLETREVLPMGALRPRSVHMQLCSASHRDLRVEVGEGRFREDLYFRISRPEVVVPPLRQRPEEVPWLIAGALQSLACDLLVHSPFVEACLLRHWPGNVRELLAKVRVAAQNALGAGGRRLDAEHLSERAGLPIPKAADLAAGCAMPWHPPIPRLGGIPDRRRIEEELARASGNVSAAARVLGLHRTQLRRLIEKQGLGIKLGDPALEQDPDE